MAPDGEGSGGKHLAYQWKRWLSDSDRGGTGSAVLLPSLTLVWRPVISILIALALILVQGLGV